MGPDSFDFNADDPIAKLLLSESRLCRKRKVVKDDYNEALATYNKEGSSMVPILGEYFNELRDNMRVCKMIRSLVESKVDAAGESLPESAKLRNSINVKTTTNFNKEFEQIQTDFFMIRAREEEAPPPRSVAGATGLGPRENTMSKYLVQDLQPEGTGSVAMEFMVFMKHVTRCTTYGEEANIGSSRKLLLPKWRT